MSVNVPSGYKQTKVGVIPEDWDVVKLGDIAPNISYGLTVRPKYVENGIPLISATEIKNGIIDYNNAPNISQDDFNKLSKKARAEKGDIFLSKTGTVGRVAYVAIDRIIAITQNIAIIRTDGKKHSHQFLLQYLITNEFQRSAIKKVNQSTIMDLQLQDIKKLIIPLPPLKEQQKIAQILTTWDDAISKQIAIIKAKEELKKGLMQKLLSGEVRFDGFDEEWEEVRFNTVCERVTRKNTVNDTNVLTISAQYGLINQKEFFNKSVASKDLSGYILLKNGEFAYNKSYSNGYPMGAVKRLNRYDQGVLSSLYIYFAIKDGDSDFYEHYFEAGFLNKEIYKIAQEGARNHGLLNMSVIEFFNDMHILKPPLAEQQKIAEVLTLADKETELLKNELEALKEQKRGLMQRLLTGEVRTNKIQEKE